MLIYLQTIETDEEKSKFEDIYRTYRGLMYHVAFERMHHEQDAEDAVHHVFMKIAENIKIIEPVSPRTKQLVVTMVNNHVTDVFRSRGRHPTTAFDDESLSRLSTNTLEGEDLLTECILKLPEQQRMVIWLKYVYGYNLHRECVDAMSLQLSSVRKFVKSLMRFSAKSGLRSGRLVRYDLRPGLQCWYR